MSLDRMVGVVLVTQTVAVGTYGGFATGLAIQHEMYEKAAVLASITLICYSASLFLFAHSFPREARSLGRRVSTGLNALRSLPDRIGNCFQTRRA